MLDSGSSYLCRVRGKQEVVGFFDGVSEDTCRSHVLQIAVCFDAYLATQGVPAINGGAVDPSAKVGLTSLTHDVRAKLSAFGLPTLASRTATLLVGSRLAPRELCLPFTRRKPPPRFLGRLLCSSDGLAMPNGFALLTPLLAASRGLLNSSLFANLFLCGSFLVCGLADGFANFFRCNLRTTSCRLAELADPLLFQRSFTLTRRRTTSGLFLQPPFLFRSSTFAPSPLPHRLTWPNGNRRGSRARAFPALV